METMMTVQDLQIVYQKKVILDQIQLNLEAGKIYCMIGPNGSGKTTLLRALSRNVRPARGKVCFLGQDLFKMDTKVVARQMAVLSQLHEATPEVTVQELVRYGRFANRSWWRGETGEDKEIVAWALERTGLTELARRGMKTLSGGERQRAWLAMAIAQRPVLLLLDEPTTFLDIAHQLEILELIARLNQEEKMTILMVLHDMNQAARYGDELIVLQGGRLYGQGKPDDILCPAVLREVFRVEAHMTTDPETGKPVCYPRRGIEK